MLASSTTMLPSAVHARSVRRNFDGKRTVTTNAYNGKEGVSPPLVLRRDVWNGTPQLQATWWTLRRDRGELRCQMYSHELGWELRLESDSVELFPRTKVCRTENEVLDAQEAWRQLLETKGWWKVGS